MELQTKKDLLGFIYNRAYDLDHKDLQVLLRDNIFKYQSGLNMAELGKLSYKRSEFIHSKIESPLEVLANPSRLFALAEWAGLLDVSCFSIIMVHYNLTMGTFYDHALHNQATAAELEELNNLKSFGPYMATELGYGNNVAALKTEAIYDHDEKCFFLNTPDCLAQKYMSYSGFSDIPKIAVVMARLKIKEKDHGVFPFVVRLCDENGLRDGIQAIPCPEKPVQGLDNGLTSFHNLRVERDHALMGEIAAISEDGEFVANIKNVRARFLKSMSRIMPGRLCVSSAALGAGKASCYIALKFAQYRLSNAPGASDTAIIHFRPFQRALFVNLSKVYAMSALTNDGKTKFLDGDGKVDNDLTTQINITKAIVTWEMADVVSNCRERVGAQGIFSINKITEYISLLQGLVTAEGDNQVLIATAAGQLVNQSPAALIHTGDECLSELSVENIITLLNARESHLHKSISENKINSAGSFFDEWNDNANDSIKLARLRGHRLALQAQAKWQCESSVAQSHLETLGRLFGLSLLKEDSAWYCSCDLVERDLIHGLDREIDRLCLLLEPHINTLIDAFGYDEALFDAPICFPDYGEQFTARSECMNSEGKRYE
ncbi:MULTISPECIES: acyl-CoA dehydrogenase family protein [Pseudoalteromonas]|uniref:acyl-CoA dehydrogenase family protein n=1 Tax=Pseudoalteromonas TaxID=53246 RepID=UPI0002F03C0D|nr:MULTISPECIES: acyl-CoA dehydrogenase [Pseudoalteromonas]MDP4486821.1 acyl-CoA dehydrogenase [Pseudoalteromonas piscicida]